MSFIGLYQGLLRL